MASPTKFAEYLYAGLKVLVSKNLGDFSSFVREHDCGYVVDENNVDNDLLKKVDADARKRCFDLANLFFKKESNINDTSYKRLMDAVLEV